MQISSGLGFPTMRIPYRLPQNSVPAAVAYQLIRDMRQLDSNPRLNLASFVVSKRLLKAMLFRLQNITLMLMEVEPKLKKP